MAMPRSLGGTSLTTLPSISMVPEVMSSSPAIMRKSVDFPQPEGPTKTTNSPSFMEMSTPLMTSTGPNDLRTSFSLTSAMLLCRLLRLGDNA